MWVISFVSGILLRESYYCRLVVEQENWIIIYDTLVYDTSFTMLYKLPTLFNCHHETISHRE